MALGTIIWIMVIILFVGIIAYLYYHYANQPEFFKTMTRTVSRNKSTTKTKNKNKKKRPAKAAIELSDEAEAEKKRVRFDSDVTYKTFPKAKSSSSGSILTPSYRPRRRSSILISPAPPNPHTSSEGIRLTDSPASASRSASETRSVSETKPIKPSNLEHSEQAWDAGFGLPLMDSKDKSRFVNKMRDNHDQYQQSMGDMTKYQMDRSTVIQTDTTIDPFKNTGGYDGLTVKDIYDRQTAGPRAKPKVISRRTAPPGLTIYSSESELNGGKLKGSNLSGFDGAVDEYQSAAFGNGFSL